MMYFRVWGLYNCRNESKKPMGLLSTTLHCDVFFIRAVSLCSGTTYLYAYMRRIVKVLFGQFEANAKTFDEYLCSFICESSAVI